MSKKTLKLIVLILSLNALVSVFSISATATDTLPPTGLIWDDDVNLDEFLVVGAGGANTTKTFVDLTDKFPTPGDQGNQQSCVGWAVAYLKSGQEAIKRGWSVTNPAHQFSPSFIYNQINDGVDEGAYINQAMNLVKDYGICSVNYFPYDEGNYTKQPSEIAKAAAALYKPAKAKIIKGVQAMKNHIANEKGGVVIGIEVYPDFDKISNSNKIYDKVYDSSRGGHAICLIGFDDSLGAFKFINSWGTNRGIGGYGWISYNLIENDYVNVLGDGRGFVLIETEKDDYILGDVNSDGKISIVDSRLVLKHIAGTETLTAGQFALADVNGDAKISIADSKNILSYIAGNITKMPLYN